MMLRWRMHFVSLSANVIPILVDILERFGILTESGEILLTENGESIIP